MTWLLLLGALGPAQWSFEQDEVGKRPSAFVIYTKRGPEAQWVVQQEPCNRFFAQVDRSDAKDRITLAILPDARFEDTRVRVRIRMTSEGYLAGIVFGFRDRENYYLVRLDRHHNNVRLDRVVDGSRIAINGQDDVEIAPQEWYTLAVKHQGPAIEVRLGGVRLFEVKDATFTGKGAIGLWVRGGSVVQFDDLCARPFEP